MKLAFYKADKGRLFDRIVNYMSGFYGYSHVEIVFSDGLCFSSSPREKGCRFKYIKFNPDKWDFVDVPMWKITEKQYFEKCREYDEKSYDWLGILLWYVIPVKWQDEKKWWCSEVCSKILGIQDFRLTPNQMAKMYGLKRIKTKVFGTEI